MEYVIKLLLNVLPRRIVFKDDKCCIQLTRDNLGKMNELVSLKSQVKALRLQDKLRKQNFQEDLKKVSEPVTKTNKNSSPAQNVTKTVTENSKENNKARANLNNKLFDMINNE